MSRSLAHQFQYVISNNMHLGESKRQYKMEHQGRVDGRIYSVQTAENLRDTARSMSAFIREHHPDVKMVRDITNVHIQEWINDRSKHWTQRTTETQISNVRAIFDRVERTYSSGISCDPAQLYAPETAKPSPRVVAMERGDLEKIRESYYSRDATTEGRTALEVAARTGLRIKEIARLETKSINLEKNIIEVRNGAKNGKYRDVPIRERDREFFAELKASRNGERFICLGREEDTLNKSIRAEMKRCGIAEKYTDTTNHAIRKLYARERMEEEREKGLSEKEAWQIVQQELGHGKEFREKLYRVYVK